METLKKHLENKDTNMFMYSISYVTSQPFFCEIRRLNQNTTMKLKKYE